MTTILFSKRHTIGKAGASTAAESIAKELQGKLNLNYYWQGDELRFKRSGADGKICVSDNDVRFELNLGLLLRPLKATIEREVQEYFRKYFG